MKEVLLRESQKSKTSLSSIKYSPTKFLLNFLRIERIQCLTLGHKVEEVEIHLVRNLLVQCVVRNIWVDAWWERVIDLVV